MMEKKCYVRGEVVCVVYNVRSDILILVNYRLASINPLCSAQCSGIHKFHAFQEMVLNEGTIITTILSFYVNVAAKTINHLT